MSRRALAALGAVLLSILLVGCVAIPTSGPLSEHAIRTGDDPPDINFLAPPPGRGDDQAEILQGFIRAGIDTRDRYATAREYLTDDLAGKWNPFASVLVTDGSQNRVDRVGATVASLTVRAQSKVDSSGLFSSDGPTAMSLSFSFRRVKGQWRISAAPDGTVLSPYNFSQLFGAYPLYFVDPSLAFLVPDLRWFPRGASAPDRIVRALLAGPAGWLGSGAVSSAIPKGTQLGADGVTISAGTATVDLSGDVLAEDAATRRRMVAQLRASLDEVGSITAVQITVRGLVVDVPAGGGSPPEADPLVGDAPLAATASALGTVGSIGVRPLDPFSAKVVPLAPRSATIDRTRSAMAVLDASGTVRVPASGDSAVVDRRGAQVAPSIDPEGFVWTAQSTGLGTLEAVDPRGAVHPVSAGATGSDGALVAFRLSRDGARIAATVATADGPVLLVGAVQRDASLVPTGIGPMLSVALPAASVIDLAWSDPVTLALLVRQDGTAVVLSQQVGGQSSSLGSPGDGSQIVGGNGGADGLRVRASDGTLLQQTGAGGWQASGAGGLGFLVVQQ